MHDASLTRYQVSRCNLSDSPAKVTSGMSRGLTSAKISYSKDVSRFLKELKIDVFWELIRIMEIPHICHNDRRTFRYIYWEALATSRTCTVPRHRHIISTFNSSVSRSGVGGSWRLGLPWTVRLGSKVKSSVY